MKIGIDLGTANVLVYVKGKGIAITEPSVVAVSDGTASLVRTSTATVYPPTGCVAGIVHVAPPPQF